MANLISPTDTNPLTNLEQTIRAHWLEYRPKMCAALQAEGKLDAAIDEASRRTREALHELMDKGEPLYFAWAEVREEWAILPPEEEEPEVFEDVEDEDDDDDAEYEDDEDEASTSALTSALMGGEQ